jgi:hypothetical protein
MWRWPHRQAILLANPASPELRRSQASLQRNFAAGILSRHDSLNLYGIRSRFKGIGHLPRYLRASASPIRPSLPRRRIRRDRRPLPHGNTCHSARDRQPANARADNHGAAEKMPHPVPLRSMGADKAATATTARFQAVITCCVGNRACYSENAGTLQESCFSRNLVLEQYFPRPEVLVGCSMSARGDLR